MNAAQLIYTYKCIGDCVTQVFAFFLYINRMNGIANERRRGKSGFRLGTRTLTQNCNSQCF